MVSCLDCNSCNFVSNVSICGWCSWVVLCFVASHSSSDSPTAKCVLQVAAQDKQPLPHDWPLFATYSPKATPSLPRQVPFPVIDPWWTCASVCVAAPIVFERSFLIFLICVADPEEKKQFLIWAHPILGSPVLSYDIYLKRTIHIWIHTITWLFVSFCASNNWTFINEEKYNRSLAELCKCHPNPC